MTTTSGNIGFWPRAAAAIIDGIILGIIGSIYMSVTGGFATKEVNATPLYLFSILYGVLFITLKGATPGKMVLKIKVTQTSGQPVDWLHAILREVIGKFISGAVLGLGYLWVAIDPQKQAWHDKIASTVVVKAQ